MIIMNKNKSKYYILYKVDYSEDLLINDIKYISEFTSYEKIKNYLRCSYRDIKTMINNSFNSNMKTFKDYTIIKE